MSLLFQPSPQLQPPPLFQPPPPPCVKCGITTVIAPAFEGGQRVFEVRCPACGHAGTYSLNYGTLCE
jgi:phage terminase large subunit GpA-like protein